MYNVFQSNIDKYINISSGKNNTIVIAYKNNKLILNTQRKKVDFLDSKSSLIISNIITDGAEDFLLLDLKDFKKEIISLKTEQNSNKYKQELINFEVLLKEKNISNNDFIELLNIFNKKNSKSKEYILNNIGKDIE